MMGKFRRTKKKNKKKTKIGYVKTSREQCMCNDVMLEGEWRAYTMLLPDKLILLLSSLHLLVGVLGFICPISS